MEIVLGHLSAVILSECYPPPLSQSVITKALSRYCALSRGGDLSSHECRLLDKSPATLIMQECCLGIPPLSPWQWLSFPFKTKFESPTHWLWWRHLWSRSNPQHWAKEGDRGIALVLPHSVGKHNAYKVSCEKQKYCCHFKNQRH